MNHREYAEHAFEHGSKPYWTAANFYSLYYVSEVKGDSEMSPELRRLSGSARKSLYKYGIIAITMELGSTGGFTPKVPNRVEISRGGEGFSYHSIKKQGYNIQNLSEEIAQLNGFGKRAVPILNNMFDAEDIGEDYSRLTLLDARDAAKVADSMGAMSDTRGFLSAAENIFSSTKSWERANFGGGPWAGICRFMLDEDQTDIMWVDTCLSIEHNNRNWLDKFVLSEDEQYILGVDSPNGLKVGDKQVDSMIALLDKVHRGEMKGVVEESLKSGEYPELRKYSY